MQSWDYYFNQRKQHVVTLYDDNEVHIVFLDENFNVLREFSECSILGSERRIHNCHQSNDQCMEFINYAKECFESMPVLGIAYANTHGDASTN